MLLAIATVMLKACLSSKRGGRSWSAPGHRPRFCRSPIWPPCFAGNLVARLRWLTSPRYVDKATIRYDLRYTVFGSEGADWGAWTVVSAPQSDSAPGQEHRHVVTSLTSGQAHAFGRKASTDGWTVARRSPSTSPSRPPPWCSIRLRPRPLPTCSCTGEPASDHELAHRR